MAKLTTEQWRKLMKSHIDSQVSRIREFQEDVDGESKVNFKKGPFLDIVVSDIDVFHKAAQSREYVGRLSYLAVVPYSERCFLNEVQGTISWGFKVIGGHPDGDADWTVELDPELTEEFKKSYGHHYSIRS